MQPAQVRRGVSAKSQLFDSLKEYLNNKNRLQPIIGLGSVIECLRAGTRSRETLYLCEVCVSRLSKADIRNHIMGSLHRYNYIKTWHPHLVSDWTENADLSKLAWPLMEKARIIERQEGTGEILLFEVEDAVYRRMEKHSEDDAVTLINILRAGQGERHPETVRPEDSPVLSNRIVFINQNQQRQPKSLRTSSESHKPPSLIQSTAAPSVESDGWSNNTPKTSALSESRCSLFDGYTGTEPLIGLSRVIECRSEDGHTQCFLCHCCRVRSNKKDVAGHLTSSSHVTNYLMETRPAQVEAVMAYGNDDHQLLQSLAKRVEQEEGRGELKVVNAPESLCDQLTGKSYHWCITMLCCGWTQTDIQKRKMAVKGTSNQDVPAEKCKRKTRGKSNPVFQVSLPLTEGPVLLERTSFSKDKRPISLAYADPFDSGPTSPPESPSEDFDTGSLTDSQLQQDLYDGDASEYAGEYAGPEGDFDIHDGGVGGYVGEGVYFNQSGYQTVQPKIPGWGNRTQHGSHDRSSDWIYQEWENKGPQTPNELPSAVSYAPSWSSSHGWVEGCTEQWCNSSSTCQVGSDVAQYYYQQQPQHPYMTPSQASLLRASGGQHGPSGEFSSHSAAAWTNKHAQAPDQAAHFPQTEPRAWQSYMGFTMSQAQAAQQSCLIQPTAQQAFHVGHGVMPNPSYHAAPTTNTDQDFAHPTVVWNPR